LTFSNKYFDPEIGSREYNRFLDEYQYSEEAGFDGLMLNEHHNTPTCMGATMNIEAGILARITRRAKVVLLGNPLPILDNPVRLAEELAMIDMISRGRLVSGFVRGTGVESLATNQPPVYNRERFNEAHDLIVKIWTQPGPFRWEGKHLQFRVVNPFERPMQKPHPPVWIPGVSSVESIIFCAEHHYPYIFLETDRNQQHDLMRLFKERANEVGYEPGPQHFGYLVRTMVADTDEQAQEIAKGFLTGNAGVGRVPMPTEFMNPIGYNSKDARTKRLQQAIRRDRFFGGNDAAGYQDILANDRYIVGNPKSVIQKYRKLLEETRVGILGPWTNDGDIGFEDSMRCIKYMGQEVIPALREISKELALPGPFETNDGTGYDQEAWKRHQQGIDPFAVEGRGRV
jgi:alkanesulfonate monooxygenase SsuD/methylene tetrahydromethanopterin reductase-like flavin-dependent oxidoreductase (luciferase family)